MRKGRQGDLSACDYASNLANWHLTSVENTIDVNTSTVDGCSDYTCGVHADIILLFV